MDSTVGGILLIAALVGYAVFSVIQDRKSVV